MSPTSQTVRLLFLCLLTLSLVASHPAGGMLERQSELELAIIVHPENDLDGLTSREFKQYMELDHRFWPDKHRVVLFQRPARTDLQKTLLEDVYGRSEKSLRKHFVGLMNKGKIGSLPSVVRKSSSVVSLVAKKPGALSVVLASEVTDGVKVLAIDGKKPGQEGYPLQLAPADSLP